MAQDYTMGTREQPKADLSPDEKLIIQNTVGFRMSHDNVVYPWWVLCESCERKYGERALFGNVAEWKW